MIYGLTRFSWKHEESQDGQQANQKVFKEKRQKNIRKRQIEENGIIFQKRKRS